MRRAGFRGRSFGGILSVAGPGRGQKVVGRTGVQVSHREGIVEAIGRRAVELILQADGTPRRETLPVSMTVRASTAPPKS